MAVLSNKLQKFRNDLEHHHLKEPASALQEAIASSCPMVVNFFGTLGEDPQEDLMEVRDTILAEEKAFAKIQEKRIASLENVNWPAPVCRLDRPSCPACSSSLIGQRDPENAEHGHVDGKCHRCGGFIGFETMMRD